MNKKDIVKDAALVHYKTRETPKIRLKIESE
jgi:hypothetical protein